MSYSHLDVEALQRRDPRAWTTLVTAHLRSQRLIVTAVQAEALTNTLARYTLQIEGESDPITLMGKLSTAREATFYAQLTEQLSFLTPTCWYQHIDEENNRSWLVLEDVPNHRPPESWSRDALEELVAELGFFHALFWNESTYLSRHAWLPSSVSASNDNSRFTSDRLSTHAIAASGDLAATLDKAAAGLQKMSEIGGWPDVLDAKHLDAAAALIDDPLPMLQPLRDLPMTLLHGYPGIYNWRYTLFNDCRLIDWQTVCSGPSVCDLVAFVETYGLLQQPSGVWTMRKEWLEAEELIIDTYMLQMAHNLGRRFDARSVRRAIPAARCLYVLTHWFTRFDTWFSQWQEPEKLWRQINRIPDEKLAQTVYKPMAGLSLYLGVVFHRFINAYYKL